MVKVGTICAIPRMLISPSDTKMPFKLNRRQYPICVCFAITINKSQGQTLSQVGLLLQRPVFSHGQLYVAISRVKSKRGLKVICCDRDDNTRMKRLMLSTRKSYIDFKHISFSFVVTHILFTQILSYCIIQFFVILSFF